MICYTMLDSYIIKPKNILSLVNADVREYDLTNITKITKILLSVHWFLTGGLRWVRNYISYSNFFSDIINPIMANQNLSKTKLQY